MTSTIKAASLAATFALLAGCGGGTGGAPVLTAESPSPSGGCRQGAIDAERVFILCPEGSGTALDAMQAMNRPADPDLDINRIAAEYGIAARAMTTGIEAATYSRIVGPGPDAASRGDRWETPAHIVTINGRDFKRVTLKNEGRPSATLYVEA